MEHQSISLIMNNRPFPPTFFKTVETITNSPTKHFLQSKVDCVKPPQEIKLLLILSVYSVEFLLLENY